MHADFPRADVVGPHKVVFNICGNRYRLIVHMRYDIGRVRVRHVVTDEAYIDSWSAGFSDPSAQGFSNGSCNPRFHEATRAAQGARVPCPLDETETPQSAVELMLEQRGMRRANLAPLMGGRARVSEFFAGKRRLSIAQSQLLKGTLGIPADLLIE